MIINFFNLVVVFVVFLVWLGVGYGWVRKSGYVNLKCFFRKFFYGWIFVIVFFNMVGLRKGN